MYIYGKNVVKEYLSQKNVIKKAYIYNKFNDNEILNKLKNQNININYLEKYDLNKIESGNHQGIILEVDDYSYESLDEIENEEIIVILDHIEDPHNFGAIIRTCEAAGIKGIIIPKDRSVKVNSTDMKVRVGTIQNVNNAKVNN